MKKTILMTAVMTVLMTALTSNAKTNFNDLIVENMNAQNELHQQIKASVDDVKKSVTDGSKTISVASESYNVKTNKDFLKFNKEKKYYKASDEKANNRIAEELETLN
jgi:hypothetical protein